MHMQIVIDATYDAVSIYDKEDLFAAVEREVNRCVQDGLLSPSREEVIDDWDFEIKETTHPDDKE